MGKPGPTSDRSASGAMINKIIRRVGGKTSTPTGSNLIAATRTNSDYIFLLKGNNAIKNDCGNPKAKNCIKAGKNTGCGC